MTTGDVKGSLRKLQASLRSVKYPGDVDYQGLAKGDPSSCLPIVSYTFTSFSSAVAEHLVERSVELVGKNDLSFVESFYKVLRDIFTYKPLLTKQQFLQLGFAERKMALLCDIIGLVLDKHRRLTKGTKVASPVRRRTAERSAPRETQRVLRSASLVERHPGVSAQVSFTEEEEEAEEARPRGQQGEDLQTSQCDQISPSTAAHTECVSESALHECVCRLQQQLNLLDARVQAVEKNTSGLICIERSTWQELENRVLLLETGLALTRAQDPVRVGEVMGEKHQHITRTEGNGAKDTSTRISSSSSEENIKERLERIAGMMKDTSSLLKNVEPTI